MAFIYGIRPKDSFDYFYIGSTKHSPEHRLKQHVDSIRLGYNKNLRFVRKAIKVGLDNLAIDVIECVDDSTRYEFEYKAIKRFRADGCGLTNIKLSEPQYVESRKRDDYVAKYESPRIQIRLMALYLNTRHDVRRNINWRYLDLTQHIDKFLSKSVKYLLDEYPDEILRMVKDARS